VPEASQPDGIGAKIDEMMKTRRGVAGVVLTGVLAARVSIPGSSAAGAFAATSASAPVTAPPPPGLGHIELPLAGASEPARQHFLRGMLALHSFWYDEARDEFQAATRAEPSFAMGYWGEALTYYHPVWTEENLVGSRAAMARIPAAARLSERDEGLLSAARILFGEGTIPARWTAYADALRKLHERFTGDDEIAMLWAVALLGNGYRDRYGGARQPDFRPFAQAGALALEVLGRNPQHPGAAHYVIHAFDDPEHAILALPAARVYAAIAPEAPHARHMPAHIFVQLGMWPEAAASNEAAWAASVAWVRRKHLDTGASDFHSLSWLESIAFEEGQRQRAHEVLLRGFAALAESRDPDHLPLQVGSMAAEYILKTGEWGSMDELLAPLRTVRKTVTGSRWQAATPGCPGHVEVSAARAGLFADAWLAFMRGEAAAARGDGPALVASRAELGGIVDKLRVSGGVEPDDLRTWKIRGLYLDARMAELGPGKPAEVVATLHSAAALEESVPALGPERDILARERLGEFLLRLNRGPEALDEFRKVLVNHPRRARSLFGAARAARSAGDPVAHEYYAELARVWEHADAEPALAEVRTAAAAGP
jgi:tetratricopeptide (TPR) repeat protein